MKRAPLVGSIVAGAAVITVGVILNMSGTSVTQQAHALQPGPPGVTPQRLGTTLARAGLGAEALAASGADAQAVEGVVVGMRAYLQAHGAVLHNAEEDLAAATTEHDALLRQIQRGQRDEPTMLALAAARNDLQDAELAVSTSLATAFDQATAGLTIAQRATITRIHDNQSDYNMPTYCAAAVWTESQWLEARAALAHTRHASDTGGTADQSAQDAIDDLMAITDVSTADSNLTSSLITCQNAWEDAVETYGGV